MAGFRPVKIFHVTGSLTRSAGGLFYSVSGLARAQFEAGADVAVIGPADDYFEEDKRIWGDVPLFPIKAPFRYATVPEAVRVILKQKPDVVNIHGIWGDPSVIGRILVAMGFRTCVSPHGMLDPWIMQRRPKLKAIHAWLFERPLV
ncbi:MAG: glycosyltransferase, partial [Sphingomonas sp.]